MVINWAIKDKLNIYFHLLPQPNVCDHFFKVYLPAGRKNLWSLADLHIYRKTKRKPLKKYFAFTVSTKKFPWGVFLQLLAWAAEFWGREGLGWFNMSPQATISNWKAHHNSRNRKFFIGNNLKLIKFRKIEYRFSKAQIDCLECPISNTAFILLGPLSNHNRLLNKEQIISINILFVQKQLTCQRRLLLSLLCA